MRYKLNVLNKIEIITNTLVNIKFQLNRNEPRENIFQNIKRFEELLQDMQFMVEQERESLNY